MRGMVIGGTPALQRPLSVTAYFLPNKPEIMPPTFPKFFIMLENGASFPGLQHD